MDTNTGRVLLPHRPTVQRKAIRPFQSDCTIIHSHQQRWFQFPHILAKKNFFPDFLNLAMLVCVKRHLTVIFICCLFLVKKKKCSWNRAMPILCIVYSCFCSVTVAYLGQIHWPEKSKMFAIRPVIEKYFLTQILTLDKCSW